MTIKGLVFDKDGTLFDFEAIWSRWAYELLTDVFASNAAEVGLALGFDLASRKFLANSPVIAETNDALSKILMRFLPGWTQDQVLERMREEVARTPMVTPVPLKPLLTDLAARGLVLGVATNDDEISARRNLRTEDCEGFFAHIYGYDSGHGGKPAPGQILAFLTASGLAPHEVAMIGDSRHDLSAGRAAGVLTIGVLTGPAKADELMDLADVILPDIGHLPAWLDQQAAPQSRSA